jgi:hypothetical protein
MSDCPTPPARYNTEPMTMADAKRWIDTYDAWVEVWNRHERSRDLPPAPEWPEAHVGASGIGGIPASVLVFRPRAGDRVGLIRLRKWRPYRRGWSYCRNEADAANIIWAGWERIRAGR